LKLVFRRFVSQPVEWVIEQINPILRGWVNYFAFGHSSRCFAFVRQWLEKKIRRHLTHSSKRQGFGWKRDHGGPYPGTKEETPDTDKGSPSGLPQQFSILPPI